MILKHEDTLVAEYHNDISIKWVAGDLSQIIEDLLHRCHVFLGIFKNRKSLMINEYQAFIRFWEILIAGQLNVKLSDIGTLCDSFGIQAFIHKGALSKVIH